MEYIYSMCVVHIYVSMCNIRVCVKALVEYMKQSLWLEMNMID